MRNYSERFPAELIAGAMRAFSIFAALTIVVLCASSCGRGSAPGPDVSADLGEYKAPWGMIVNADETRLYVANYLLSTVDVVDIATMRVSNSIPVMCDPRRLAFNSNRTKLFVTHDNQLETRYCSTSKYLPSQLRRNGAWLTVIDVAQLKVVNEISLMIEGADPSQASDIVYDPIYDVLYVTARSNFFITAVDPNTETTISRVAHFSGKSPYRIRLDSDRGIGYAIDKNNNRIYPFATDDPRTESFTSFIYDGQTTGICGGTKGNKNNCPCTANSNCNSNYCDYSPMLPYCAASCSGSNSKKTGCPCASGAGCDSGICGNSGICVTESSFGVNDIRAFCDRSTLQCKTASQMGITNTCENPWDALPAPDQSLYVTCGGSTSKADQTQPVLKIYADADGFASNNTAVAAQSSFQYCVKPTELAADKDWKYVFVLCSGSNKLLYLDAASGEPLGSFSVPRGSYGMTVSSNYVFVSSSSQNEIVKLSIP